MRPIQSAVLQAKHIGHVMLWYQFHFGFFGEGSLGFPVSIAEWEQWKFKHGNSIVSGSQSIKKLVELNVESLAVGVAEKIVASNFNQDQRVASSNACGLIHGRFNSRGWFCEI